MQNKGKIQQLEKNIYPQLYFPKYGSIAEITSERCYVKV